jgi:Skp family chaperone for outer membrane proteins
MRSTLILASLLAVCLSATSLPADDKAQQLPIATIDALRILKSHKPTAGKLETLRADVKALEEKIQLRQVELEQLQRKLAGRPQPGEDREKLQLQFAKLQTELRQYVERERQNVQRREAKIQVEVYKQIQAEVGRISKERGLKLVMVRPRLSVDSEDPQEVGRALNQAIIYEEGLDITDEVLKALELKAEASTEEPSDETTSPEAPRE